MVQVLEVGEDHRFRKHFGFDPIAIIRALYRIAFSIRLEGASTIEQQYVRSCTGRTDISLTRKIEEISIAILLSLTSRKNDIAYSYLAHAYFGEDAIGYKYAQMALTNNPHTPCMDTEELSAIIAMLKHPMPRKINGEWVKRHARRTRHIHQRFLKINSANNSLEADVHEEPHPQLEH